MKYILRLITATLAGLLLLPAAIFAQGALRGQVSDTEGNPLSGVTVMVKGTARGTMTDLDGNYTLPLPAAKSYSSPVLASPTKSAPGTDAPR